MKHPFDYHRPSETQVEQISTVRDGCKALHAILLALPSNAERTLAIRKLEEVSMWANKGIVMADEGPVDNGRVKVYDAPPLPIEASIPVPLLGTGFPHGPGADRG